MHSRNSGRWSPNEALTVRIKLQNAIAHSSSCRGAAARFRMIIVCTEIGIVYPLPHGGASIEILRENISLS